MKNTKVLIMFTTICLLTLHACGKDDDDTEMEVETMSEEVIEVKSDCAFTQVDEDLDGLIDETESRLMNECTENPLTTVAEVKANLIGEWELIGHGEGWIPTVSQPCGYITFFENELQFEFNDGWQDTVTMHQWDIEELSWSGGEYLNLVVSPNEISYALFINQFCSEYMYSNATPLDGNMYLYEKIK